MAGKYRPLFNKSEKVTVIGNNWDHGPNLALAKTSQKNYHFSMLGIL